jgi:RNA polymerase sporulation-specific sigma factor
VDEAVPFPGHPCPSESHREIAADDSQECDDRLVVSAPPDGERQDEWWVERAQRGDRQAQERLVQRYRWVCATMAARYFLPGGERDDLYQEAMIGLLRAIRDYHPGRGRQFRSFVALCVRRQVITAVKYATRLKQEPLNAARSLDEPLWEHDPGSPLLGDLLEDPQAHPLDEMVAQDETHRELADTMNRVLTPYEVAVLRGYLAGQSYAAIAEALGTHAKSIDNALLRARRKLREAYQSAASGCRERFQASRPCVNERARRGSDDPGRPPPRSRR